MSRFDEELERELEAEKRRQHHLRRLDAGKHPRCRFCGEGRPAALMRVGEEVICYECKQRRERGETMEAHHTAGRHNDPAAVPLPANDHAVLSDLQRSWPERTLRNVDRSPLLKHSAKLRGLLDALRLTVAVLEDSPEELEDLDQQLRATDGPEYWVPPGEDDPDSEPSA